MTPPIGKIAIAFFLIMLGFGSSGSVSAESPLPHVPASVVNAVRPHGLVADGSGSTGDGSDVSGGADAGGIVASSGGLVDTALAAPRETPAAGAPIPADKRFAVIIGIDYDHYDFGNVRYASLDARAAYDMLTRQMGFPAENIIMLRNGEATYDNMTRALDWLTSDPRIDSGSEVVFFYSGHGLRNGPGEGMNTLFAPGGAAVVPFDYYRYDFRNGQGLIWGTRLAQFLGRISPAKMWINIDSCSAGGFAIPGITGPNRVVTMSSRIDELSGELVEVNRGVFTRYLVDMGMVYGLPVEDAFNVAVPQISAQYSQNPLIADEYPGTLDLR